MKKYKAYYDSPIGIIEVCGTEEGICSLIFIDKKEELEEEAECLKECLIQLDEYFKGQRKVFTVKCTMDGTEFQKKVWKELTNVPYAKTASYREIAVAVGNEKAVRAVGSTNSRNPVSIIVPCHRVIGSNGKLTGYAGGLWRKEWLLQHEKDNL